MYYLDAPDGSETGEPLDRDAFDQWVSENVGKEEKHSVSGFDRGCNPSDSVKKNKTYMR